MAGVIQDVLCWMVQIWGRAGAGANYKKSGFYPVVQKIPELPIRSDMPLYFNTSPEGSDSARM